MLAILVAAQIVLWKGTLAPKSLQEAYKEYAFFGIVSTSGLLPATLLFYACTLVG